MTELGDFLVITEAEYSELEEKAKVIYAQRESKTLNMRLKFPYYIPYKQDVNRHQDIPMSTIIPYYVYLMTMDDDGKYLVEPDDEYLNDTRDYMRQIYDKRILVVQNKNIEKEYVNKFKKVKK